MVLSRYQVLRFSWLALFVGLLFLKQWRMQGGCQRCWLQPESFPGEINVLLVATWSHLPIVPWSPGPGPFTFLFLMYLVEVVLKVDMAETNPELSQLDFMATHNTWELTCSVYEWHMSMCSMFILKCHIWMFKRTRELLTNDQTLHRQDVFAECIQDKGHKITETLETIWINYRTSKDHRCLIFSESAGWGRSQQ